MYPTHQMVMGYQQDSPVLLGRYQPKLQKLDSSYYSYSKK